MKNFRHFLRIIINKNDEISKDITEKNILLTLGMLHLCFYILIIVIERAILSNASHAQ